MTTANIAKRSAVVVGTATTLAVAAFAFSGAAQARDNLAFSVGIGVPAVQVGVSNAYPVYTQRQPVYVQQAPVYLQPAPVYVQPLPVYYNAYGQPVYAAPQPVYHEHRHHGHWRGGYYQRPHGHGFSPGYGPGYGPGYAPVYYQRDGRDVYIRR